MTDLRITLPRLKKRAEFLAAQAARRKFVTPGMIVQARAQGTEDAMGLRLGFTVSKKVGNAVQRNRAKRRLRAAAAETLAVYANCNYDLVMIGRTETLTRDYRGALRRSQAGSAKAGGCVIWLVTMLIRLYQLLLSPFLAMAGGSVGGCRFHPNCSAYAIEAVQTHGAAKGTWLAVKRLARCHPFAPGGLDKVPGKP